jgi:hypothetical protein
MPIPTSKPSQPEREFMSACMTDSVMLTEYPDASQRAAVCHRQWARTHETAEPPPSASQADTATVLAHRLSGLTDSELLVLRAAATRTQPRRRQFQSKATDIIGARAYRALRQAFREYLRQQARRFPVGAVREVIDRTRPRITEAARLVEAVASGDIGGSDLELILRDWQWSGTEDILSSAAETLATAVSQEQAAFLGRLARQFGIAQDVDARVTANTALWATEHSASLVTEINESTRATMRTIIGQGLDARDNSEQIARNLQNFVTDEQLTDYRAKLIARTEQSFAQSKADDDVARDTGAGEKEWNAAGDSCDICLNNEADGVIGINEAFSSGDMTPPAHPNCVCVVLYHGQTPENVEQAIQEYLATSE